MKKGIYFKGVKAPDRNNLKNKWWVSIQLERWNKRMKGTNRVAYGKDARNK